MFRRRVLGRGVFRRRVVRGRAEAVVLIDTAVVAVVLAVLAVVRLRIWFARASVAVGVAVTVVARIAARRLAAIVRADGCHRRLDDMVTNVQT